MPYDPVTCFMVEKADQPVQWYIDFAKTEKCEPDDPRKRLGIPFYRRLDTGEIVEGLPPGAMFDPDVIYGGETKYHGPDGKGLVVILPSGENWHIDSPASNGAPNVAGWKRTGVPPTVTARPSIQTSLYHGFLTDGVLTEC